MPKNILMKHVQFEILSLKNCHVYLYKEKVAQFLNFWLKIFLFIPSSKKQNK